MSRGPIPKKEGRGSHETAVFSVYLMGISLAMSLTESTAWESAVPAAEPPTAEVPLLWVSAEAAFGGHLSPRGVGGDTVGRAVSMMPRPQLTCLLPCVSELTVSGNALDSLVG